MGRPERYVSHLQARRIYDIIGRRQDSRLLSERRALDELAERCHFEQAHSVFEFGCGTGSFARRLLCTRLPADCRYEAVDVSPTMVALARQALAPWPERTHVQISDGRAQLAAEDATVDRFVCTYVLDLLSPADQEDVLAEAHRLLRPDGLLCLASLTHGRTRAAGLLIDLWERAWRLRPWLVGGCRPIELAPLLSGELWLLRQRALVNVHSLTSEVLVARRV